MAHGMVRAQIVTPVPVWVENEKNVHLVPVYPSSIAPDLGPVRVSFHFIFHGFHGRRLIMKFALAFYKMVANFQLWNLN